MRSRGRGREVPSSFSPSVQLIILGWRTLITIIDVGVRIWH